MGLREDLRLICTTGEGIAMANIEELKKEAEEAKERMKRDMVDFRDILRKIALEAGENGRTRAEAAMHRAEKRIEETVSRVETRMDKAIAVLSGPETGTGKVVTREFDLSDFTNVEVACCFRVDIVQSDSYSVTVTSDESLFDYINVDKSGNTLKISIKPFHFHTRPTLGAHVTMPMLNKLRLSAAAKCSVNGFSSQEKLDLNLSGASSLDIDIEASITKVEVSGASKLHGNMRLGDSEFTLSGASRMELKGSARDVELNAWGASRLEMAGYTLGDAKVDLKGASQAVVSISGKLDLNISGSSRFTYCGSPTMGSIKVSGASTLTQK